MFEFELYTLCKQSNNIVSFQLGLFQQCLHACIYFRFVSSWMRQVWTIATFAWFDTKILVGEYVLVLFFSNENKEYSIR